MCALSHAHKLLKKKVPLAVSHNGTCSPSFPLKIFKCTIKLKEKQHKEHTQSLHLNSSLNILQEQILKHLNANCRHDMLHLNTSICKFTSPKSKNILRYNHHITTRQKTNKDPITPGNKPSIVNLPQLSPRSRARSRVTHCTRFLYLLRSFRLEQVPHLFFGVHNNRSYATCPIERHTFWSCRTVS